MQETLEVTKARTKRARSPGEWSLKATVLLWVALALIPTVYLLLVAVLATVMLAAVGIVGGLGYLVVVNRAFGWSLPALGLVLFFLVAIYGVIRAIIVSFFRPPTFHPAVWINPNREPDLVAFIQELCDALHTRFPTAIVIHAGPDFFVMDGELTVLNATPKGRILCLSLPLMATLTVDELRAVLAHEFAHFTGRDTLYSAATLRVYRGTAEAGYALYMVWARGNWFQRIVLALPLLLPAAVLGLYHSVFYLIDRAVSRTREYRADYIAAKLTGARASGVALKKAHAYTLLFYSVFQKVLEKVRKQPDPPDNPYRVFRKSLVRFGPFADKLLQEALVEQRQRWGDSHPTLYNRLQALEHLDADLEDAPKANGGASALTLLARLKDYEKMNGDFIINEYEIQQRAAMRAPVMTHLE